MISANSQSPSKLTAIIGTTYTGILLSAAIYLMMAVAGNVAQARSDDEQPNTIELIFPIRHYVNGTTVFDHVKTPEAKAIAILFGVPLKYIVLADQLTSAKQTSEETVELDFHAPNGYMVCDGGLARGSQGGHLGEGSINITNQGRSIHTLLYTKKRGGLGYGRSSFEGYVKMKAVKHGSPESYNCNKNSQYVLFKWNGRNERMARRGGGIPYTKRVI